MRLRVERNIAFTQAYGALDARGSPHGELNRHDARRYRTLEHVSLLRRC